MSAASAMSDSEFDEVRRRRAELRETMGELERALAAPASGRPAEWADGVRLALVVLESDFREHIAVTEGPNGLHQDIVTAALRLSNGVARLTVEHGVITEQVNDLLGRFSAGVSPDDIDGLRDGATALLGLLVRHRQRGADLIYEAFVVDVGGQD
jgi:hypothetical protein